MISINRIASAMQGFFEAMAKARVNSVLLGMDRDQLAKCGYSYELLRRGPSAWPWRETTQDGASEAGKTTCAGAQQPAFTEATAAIAKHSPRDSRNLNGKADDFNNRRDAA